MGNDTGHALTPWVRNAVREGRLPPGLIFSGPAREEKRRAAVELAQALNCTADGECESCRRIQAGRHPDVRWVVPEEGKRSIALDQVREIRRAAPFHPHEGKARVWILDPADWMTPAAQNGFLKTLEEPPAENVFVLLTGNMAALLPTVISRCAVVRFPLGVPRYGAARQDLADAVPNLGSRVRHRVAPTGEPLAFEMAKEMAPDRSGAVEEVARVLEDAGEDLRADPTPARAERVRRWLRAARDLEENVNPRVAVEAALFEEERG